ncbi:MAG: hypothetical protein K2X32_12940 [Phycisphaerales bacterium]|nr:hypothetical protein [Phycisphaerales bacterium]
MSAPPIHPVTHSASLVTHAEELLEEHHVVAYSRNIGARERFALELIKHLHAMVEVQTVVLSGTGIHDLDSFCRQLDRTLPGAGSRMRRTIDGPGGICDRMRDRPSDLASHIKHRYYIWRDADVLLKHNPRLFARLADAMMGVAAESEYASEDLLLLHRVVFIGATPLHTCFRDSKGPLRSWLSEAPAGSKPLWAVVTGIEHPPTAELVLA